MRIDFCLPAKNEEKIIAQNVGRLKVFLEEKNWPFVWRIIIVVNGSNDSSWEIAKGLEGEKVKAVHIEAAGKGLAIKTCFTNNLSDILVFLDIDLAVSLENIPGLLEPLMKNESSLVIGSRLLPESVTVRGGFREISSRLYNRFSRLVLSHDFSDLQCGFKAIKGNVFAEVGPFVKDDHWFFDTELVMMTKHLGYEVKEIAVNWQENRYDERKSKVNILGDSWTFIRNSLFLKFRLMRMNK